MCVCRFIVYILVERRLALLGAPSWCEDLDTMPEWSSPNYYTLALLKRGLTLADDQEMHMNDVLQKMTKLL